MYQQHRSVLWDLNFKALAIQLYQQEAQPVDTKVSHTQFPNVSAWDRKYRVLIKISMMQRLKANSSLKEMSKHPLQIKFSLFLEQCEVLKRFS